MPCLSTHQLGSLETVVWRPRVQLCLVIQVILPRKPSQCQRHKISDIYSSWLVGRGATSWGPPQEVVNIKCQVSEETFGAKALKKKSRPQATEALLRACFVQVLSPGKASGRERAAGRLEWQFRIVGGITLDGVWPFKRREWHEQRHGGRNV